MLRNRYRKTFGIAAGTSAAPYGYTLATCTIGAVPGEPGHIVRKERRDQQRQWEAKIRPVWASATPDEIPDTDTPPVGERRAE